MKNTICSHCNQEKEFYKIDSKLTNSWCKDCIRKKYKHRHVILKIAAMFHYSNGTMSCNCCNEKGVCFLEIDHINNNGAEHRKNDESSKHLYQWLKTNNYPEGFQVLCKNCNSAKSFNDGICPHVTGILIKPSEEIELQELISPTIKEIKIKKLNYCSCGKTIDRQAKMCVECNRINNRKNWPTKEELKKLLWEIPTTEIGKKFNVSDKAVEKWTKIYEIQKPPRGYWQKKKSENKLN